MDSRRRKSLGEIAMSKRGAGISFCAIATVIFAVRYISASILGSSLGSSMINTNPQLFQNLLDNIGVLPTALSIISLILVLVVKFHIKNGRFQDRDRILQ